MVHGFSGADDNEDHLHLQIRTESEGNIKLRNKAYFCRKPCVSLKKSRIYCFTPVNPIFSP